MAAQKEEGKQPFKQFFFRLASSEHVVDTNIKDHITLNNLFKPRQLKNGIEGIPKRILVKGCAGVGKTTLAKKSVYDHLHYGLWRDHFNWVLWIPLGRITGKPERYSFETLLQDEYFRRNRYGEALAAALSHSIQTTPAKKTLLILDGLNLLTLITGKQLNSGKLF